MKISDWAENLRVSIVGAGDHVCCVKGFTTARQPFRDGDVTKTEVMDDKGRVRAVAISRVKINGVL